MFIINSHKKEIMIYTNVKTLPSLRLKRIIVFGHEMCQFFFTDLHSESIQQKSRQIKKNPRIKATVIIEKLLSEQLLLIYRLIHFMSVYLVPQLACCLLLQVWVIYINPHIFLILPQLTSKTFTKFIKFLFLSILLN